MFGRQHRERDRERRASDRREGGGCPIAGFAERRRGYHHGDLKRALIDAADSMIEETGADELSLRGLAHEIGVSRMAAYNHFEDKSGLLAEIVRLGFEALERRLTEPGPVPESPREALARAAEAYIALAAERPERFRLMFSKTRVDLARHQGAAAAAAGAYAALRRIVTQAAGGEAAGAATLAAWSLVHGFAVLRAELGERFVETAGQGISPAYMAAALIDGVKTASVFAPDFEPAPAQAREPEPA